MAEPAFAIGELLKLVVALGVTIGLFYALALFMKRLQVGTGRSGSLITVLAALPLGGKEKIWVVDVAGEKLVIGTTPGSVNCLHVLRAGQAADVLTAEAGEAVAESPGTAPSSFRRRPEYSVVELTAKTTLDPGLRRGDELVRSDGSRGFADLLAKFKGWQK